MRRGRRSFVLPTVMALTSGGESVNTSQVSMECAGQKYAFAPAKWFLKYRHGEEG